MQICCGIGLNRMYWTKSEYPPEMKYLPMEVRRRAIKLANSLIKETQMKETAAISAAIAMARSTSTNQEIFNDTGLKKHRKHSKERCSERFVIPYQGRWAIRVENSDKVQEVFSTKKLAVEQAKREAFLTGAALTIFKKDGSVEKRVLYNRHTKSQESEKSLRKSEKPQPRTSYRRR